MVEAVKEQVDIKTELANIFMNSRSNLVAKEKLVSAEKAVLADDTLIPLSKGEATPISTSSKQDFRRLYSDLFVKEIMPYGFSLVALVYKVAPLKSDTDVAFTYNHGWGYYNHRAKPDLSTKEIDRVYELEYNLRDKVHVIRKNGKELKFSENNMTNMFASHDPNSLLKTIDALFVERRYDELKSHEVGKYNISKPRVEWLGMYEATYRVLGAVGGETTVKMARFLERLMFLNKIELLYKSNLGYKFALDFAEDIAKLCIDKKPALQTYNPNGSKPHQVLGMPKALIKHIVDTDMSYTDVTKLSGYIAEVRKQGTESGDPQIMAKKERNITTAVNTYLGLVKYTKEFDEQYGLDKSASIPSKEAKGIFGMINNPNMYQDGAELQAVSASYFALFTHTPLKQMVEYIYYRLDVEQGLAIEAHTYSRGFTIYRDYINLATELQAKRDKFPKYLKTQHDILARNQSFMDDPDLAKTFEKNLGKLLAFEDIDVRGSKYKVIAPRSMEDIIREGSNMNHCVGSYARRVAKGDTIILFLRDKKAPDESLVTLEINNLIDLESIDDTVVTALVQAKGHYNSELTADQDAFLTAWTKKANVTRKSV